MSQAYSLTVQAALGNRFACILLAAQLRRAECREREDRSNLAMLRRRHAWLTPDGPRRDDTQEESACDQGRAQEGAGQEGQGPSAAASPKA